MGEEVFQLAKNLNQETAVLVTGEIREDSRSKFGYEIGISGIEVVGESHEYPITPKEHGTDFLMDHRHLWLRSSKQHAIMQIRNEVIRATYEFFNNNGFIKIDPPILTGSAPEGTTDLFETNYFDQKAYLSQSGQLYMEAAAMAFGKSLFIRTDFPCRKVKNASSSNRILDDRARNGFHASRRKAWKYKNNTLLSLYKAFWTTVIMH